jgi:ABC-type Fe3+/spermidine/putrescine transport system ATPase subunit
MLQLNAIAFAYQEEKTVQNISFTAEKGTITAIIGESGCGKSTVLKLIYGLYDLQEGTIFWNTTEVKGPKYNLIPGMSFMKYLAQDFDLMPFITVEENVGKYLSNFYPEEKKQRIAELLEIVEMTDYATTKAKYLSGGQMQRVALARVLALEPEVLLLDEPFSHIDNFMKNSLRRKLFAYLKEKEITTIVATHDSTDVLSFADKVLVLKDGERVLHANPTTLFTNPPSKYVASLFGEINEIPGHYFDQSKPKLLFPHQLKVVQIGKLKVTVSKSYFRGNHYLVETNYPEGTLYLESEVPLNPNHELFIEQKN